MSGLKGTQLWNNAVLTQERGGPARALRDARAVDFMVKFLSLRLCLPTYLAAFSTGCDKVVRADASSGDAGALREIVVVAGLRRTGYALHSLWNGGAKVSRRGERRRRLPNELGDGGRWVKEACTDLYEGGGAPSVVRILMDMSVVNRMVNDWAYSKFLFPLIMPVYWRGKGVVKPDRMQLCHRCLGAGIRIGIARLTVDGLRAMQVGL